MLGQLTRQQEPHGRLHLSAGDGGAVVVLSQARRLHCQPLKDVINKRVHDAHGLGGDSCVRVHLQGANEALSHTSTIQQAVGLH